jgi:hypothetical protein
VASPTKISEQAQEKKNLGKGIKGHCVCRNCISHFFFFFYQSCFASLRE